eukprot:gene9320-11423_t
MDDPINVNPTTTNENKESLPPLSLIDDSHPPPPQQQQQQQQHQQQQQQPLLVELSPPSSSSSLSPNLLSTQQQELNTTTSILNVQNEILSLDLNSQIVNNNNNNNNENLIQISDIDNENTPIINSSPTTSSSIPSSPTSSPSPLKASLNQLQPSSSSSSSSPTTNVNHKRSTSPLNKLNNFFSNNNNKTKISIADIVKLHHKDKPPMIPRDQIVDNSFLDFFNTKHYMKLVNYIFLKVGALDMASLICVNKFAYKTGMNEKMWTILIQQDFDIDANELVQLIKYNGGTRSSYVSLYFKDKHKMPPPSSPNPLVKWFLNPISRIPNLFQRKEFKTLMYGLDNSGKTTMLYKFARGENVPTLHTNGYNVEIVEYKSCDFICWDIGYEQSLIPVWHHYLQDSQAIIFVIDSSDRSRLPLVKEELWKLITDKNVEKILNFKYPSLNNSNNNLNSNNNNSNNNETSSSSTTNTNILTTRQEHQRKVKVLIYSNKIDSRDSISTLDITLSLELHRLPKNICWHVQGCSATSEDGDGLYEGLDWLSSQFD